MATYILNANTVGSAPINEDALFSQIDRSLFREREIEASECRPDIGLSLYLIR
jgi:hypothetical protein